MIEPQLARCAGCQGAAEAAMSDNRSRLAMAVSESINDNESMARRPPQTRRPTRRHEQTTKHRAERKLWRSCMTGNRPRQQMGHLTREVNMRQGSTKSITATTTSCKTAVLLLLLCLAIQTNSDSAWASSSPHPSSSSLSAPPPPSQRSTLKRELSPTRPGARPVCQVNSGESVAIVEIEESRGSDMGQATRPLELPISGSSDQLELKIESETHKYFHIQDKRLKLLRPLDRDAVLKQNSSSQLQQQPITSIYLQVSCRERNVDGGKKVIVPVLVKVLDLNDNAPKFSAPFYTVQVDELAPVGTVVFDQLQAIDLDSANNGLVEYSVLGAPPHQPPARLIQRTPQSTSTEAPITITTTTTKTTTTTTTQQPSTIVVVSTTPGVISSFASYSSSPQPETTRFDPQEALLKSTTTSLSLTPSEPSINLNNEPIINGPMEETEEESDEALLASMNSTDSSNGEGDDGPDSPDLPMMLQVRPTLTHRWRRSAVLFRKRMFADEITTLRPKAGLWTNLMSQPDPAELPATVAATNPPPSPAMLTENALAQSQLASEFFALEFASNTNRPIIKLKKKLDYESKRVHQLVIVATDKASNKSERLSSSVTLIVRVLDGDDQGPAFILDQTGCATGSLPMTTTSNSATTTEAPHLVSQLVKRSVQENGETRANVPKGFKVTEENFDFSDAGPADAGDLEPTNDEPMNGGPVRVKLAPMSSSQSPQLASNSTTINDLSQIAYSCLPLAGQSSGGQTGAVVEYYATVMSGDTDYLLRVAPQAIKARDRDELNAPIRYSFINGTPTNYSQYFQINAHDATIKQVTPLDRKQVSRFEIWLQAQEQSANRLASVAKLNIEVVPSDKNPPVLVPNSYSGFVEENSPLGTQVLIDNNINLKGKNFMRINVIDADYYATSSSSSPPVALYEFETTSEAFKVNKDGFVYVNKWPLDRDLPHQAVHMFQVTARQVGLISSKSVSGPVSINVTLLDLNDNAPVIANSSFQQPLQMQAGGSPGSSRFVTKIQALDQDEGDNARCYFSIHHVSNNGRDRFKINTNTGELEALGRFQSGEQFSLTLQVIDDLSRSSQAILELSVVPGANTGGPQFVQADGQAVDGSSGRVGYVLEINEGLAPQSAILQLRAVDPENDPITYSIVDGNINEDFHLNAKTGVLSVAKRLDREEVSAYNLLVQARDSYGLASSRPISITITDNNDQNPTFSSRNYTFSVEEGPSAVGRIIGRVMAVDGDAGENGLVSYYLDSSLLDSSGSRSPFSIDEKSGDIRLEEALDYEQSKVHTLVVTAKDHGETPRSNTQSVQIKVLDQQDEAPYFERYFQELRVVENSPNSIIGQVQARDLDSVAQITYVLRSGDPDLFSVDSQTGVVSTNSRGLDYEDSRKHILLIGTVENYLEKDSLDLLSRKLSDSQQSLQKSPICRLDILVQDLNDNAPQFVNQPLPIRVQDTAQLGSQVTRVEAHDADGSEPNNQVRYELLVSPTSSSLTEPQDYLSTTKSDELIMGVTSDRCAQSFMVDPSSGSISVKWDLRRDSQSECQLIIRARDLPAQEQSSLSSVTQVTIYIDHLAEISVTTIIGFADSSFTVEVEENLGPNSLVKVLPIVNKPKSNFPMSCEIISGNELAKFYILDNEQRDCELRTSRDPQRSQLDYEIKQKYSLTLRLNTIGSSSTRLVTHVQVNLLDANDNRPQFQPVARYSHLLDKGHFLAAVASDAPSETQVFQLKATDLDSPHSNGLVTYELLNDHELESRFKVNSVDGMVRTSRPVEDLLVGSPSKLPLRLKVLARDNPEVASNSLESLAEIVVNLIEDRHRIALVLKDSPTARVMESKEELLGSIQERTGLLAGLERVESLKIQRNGSLEADVGGTDFWFYLIEPGSLRIVPSDDVRIRSGLFAERSRQSLFDVLQQTLGLAKPRLRLPYSISGLLRSGTSGGRISLLASSYNNEPFGSGLIWFALSIAIISAIVLIYQCGFWSSGPSRRNLKSSAEKQLSYLKSANQFYGTCPKSSIQQQLNNPLDPYGVTVHRSPAFSSLEPPGNVAGYLNHMVPPNLAQNTTGSSQFSKEYETQMLKMSVLFDDSHSVDEQSNFHHQHHQKPVVDMEVRG